MTGTSLSFIFFSLLIFGLISNRAVVAAGCDGTIQVCPSEEAAKAEYERAAAADEIEPVPFVRK